MVPQPKKRKKIRTLQHRGTVGSGASPASRLSPHLSNIDKLRQSSNISPVISSAASSERRHVRLGQDAGTITATPGGNTVSDITIGASDQFNAFRVNEK
jgi:hypothetical protein